MHANTFALVLGLALASASAQADVSLNADTPEAVSPPSGTTYRSVQLQCFQHGVAVINAHYDNTSVVMAQPDIDLRQDRENVQVTLQGDNLCMVTSLENEVAEIANTRVDVDEVLAGARRQ